MTLHCLNCDSHVGTTAEVLPQADEASLTSSMNKTVWTSNDSFLHQGPPQGQAFVLQSSAQVPAGLELSQIPRPKLILAPPNPPSFNSWVPMPRSLRTTVSDPEKMDCDSYLFHFLSPERYVPQAWDSSGEKGT